MIVSGRSQSFNVSRHKHKTNISFVMSVVAHYGQNPTSQHWQITCATSATRWILAYTSARVIQVTSLVLQTLTLRRTLS